MVRDDFIDCLGELLAMGFDLKKNTAGDLISATFEYMRESGCTDESNIEIVIGLWKNH